MVGQIHHYIMPAYLPLPTLRPASVEPMSDEESMSHQSWASKPRLFLPRKKFACPSSPQQCCRELLWPAACTLISQEKGERHRKSVPHLTHKQGLNTGHTVRHVFPRLTRSHPQHPGTSGCAEEG